MTITKRIPDKSWIYVLGFFVILLMFSLPYMGGEGFAMAFISAFLISLLVTAWLLVVHLLWYSDSLILKIIAIVAGGLPAVLLVIFIQFIYENVILARKVS